MFNTLQDETKAEVRDLLDRGFKPGWIQDLEIGDIFIVVRDFPRDEPEKLCVVERFLKHDTIEMRGEDEFVQNTVVNMIVFDEDGLERPIAYGFSYPIYIFRG